MTNDVIIFLKTITSFFNHEKCDKNLIRKTAKIFGKDTTQSYNNGSFTEK